MPDSLLPPFIDEDLGVHLVMAAASLWPGAPSEPRVTFEYKFLETMRSMQHQWVSVRCHASKSESSSCGLQCCGHGQASAVRSYE